MNVLIVDDDGEVRQCVKQMLELKLDASVIEASDGFAALEILKRIPIHTIITDIQMPKMNGLEFISHVKKLAISAPVIFQTGFADKDVAIQALRLGAFDFIEK